MSQPRSISPCSVCISPMGLSCQISVEGRNNADWLIQKLANEGFESTEPSAGGSSDHWVFQCLTKNEVQKNSVEQLLVNWPEVQLQLTRDDAECRIGPEAASRPDSTPVDPLAKTPGPSDVGEPFCVWLRPLGNAWKVRVEGTDGCRWLRQQLIGQELSCTDPVNISDTDLHVFRCMSEAPHEAGFAWGLLKALPRVLLQNDPA